MVHITYDELKTFDKEKGLDNIFNYDKIDNTINCSGFWACGITKSNFEVYSDGRIILRFYDKKNSNIAGLNLFPHQEIKIDLNTGMISIIWK